VAKHDDDNDAVAAGFAAQLLEDLPPADVRHVLSVFAADLRRLVAILTTSLQARDVENFRRTAHALAGAAGAVGAAVLEQAARAAMLAAAEKSTDPTALARLNQAIQDQVADCEAASRAVLRRLGTPDA